MTNNPRIAALIIEALTTADRGKGISSRGSIAFWKQINLSAGKVLPESISEQEWNNIINSHLNSIMAQKENVRDPGFLRGAEPYRVLSLGAGVQSTVLALMAERGEFGLPKPDIAIFADTQWEPPAVYEHLEWIKSQVSFEIKTVTAGNIKENLLNGVMPDNSRFIGIPIFLAKDERRFRPDAASMHYPVQTKTDSPRIEAEAGPEATTTSPQAHQNRNVGRHQYRRDRPSQTISRTMDQQEVPTDRTRPKPCPTASMVSE